MFNYNLNNIHEWPMPAKAFIIGLSCAIVFYLAYYFDFTKLNKQLALEQTQETDLKLQLEMLYQNQAKLNQHVLQNDELKKILNEWQSKLVKQATLPELLNEILKAGAASGVQFTLFNPEKEENESEYIKTPIKIVATSNYHQIANFVSRVANIMPIVVVDDITISKPMSTTTGLLANQLTAELMLDIYSLKGMIKNDGKK